MQSDGLLCRLLLTTVIFLNGCYSLPLDSHYQGPEIRPESVNNYYHNPLACHDFTEQLIEKHANYKIKRIAIKSSYGNVEIDLYLRHKTSKNIILIFPVLKGKPVVESHFAKYFAENGFDTAVVGRNSDFINPDYSDRLESVLNENVIRDKIVMDYLQAKYDKSSFGSLGISRGAINAAITAGADPRLKHNILLLGGSDIPALFENSNQGRIKKYVRASVAMQNISRKQFFINLGQNIKSYPKYLAQYIDARHTLLVLGLFDTTVPLRYGRRLRKQLGNPRTIYLLADHYVSLGFTKTACSLLSDNAEVFCVFPFDYIETEALNFYRKSMGISKATPKLITYRILSIPFEILGRLTEAIF